MQSKRTNSRGCSGAPCFAKYRGDAHSTRRLGASERATNELSGGTPNRMARINVVLQQV